MGAIAGFFGVSVGKFVAIGMVVALAVAFVSGVFGFGIQWEKLRSEARDANYSATTSDAQRDVYDDNAPGVRSPYAVRQ